MNDGSRSIQARRMALVLLASGWLAAPVFGSGGQSTATRDFKKTLTMETNQTLSLEHKFGDVRIHAENTREVKIAATIRVQSHSQADADKFADEVKIEVSQDSSGIKVRTVYPNEGSGFKVFSNGSSFSADYDITVPVDAKLWMRNNFGNVEIRGVHGWADVENGHGRLAFQDGGSSKLTNSFGSVELNAADGGVTIVNTNGSVTANTVRGALDIKDRFASITVNHVQGAVTISGGNGAVEVVDAGGAKINNSFGSVNARNIHGELVVNDNNGAIEVNAVSGAAQLNTSFGSINFTNVNGAVRCTSSNGRVHGNQAGGEVYVKTTFGEVSLEQINGPVEVEDSNGGMVIRDIKGKAMLNTSFGGIDASGLPKGVRATTGNGRISLTDVGGEVYAKTSFGAVSVQRVNGGLIIENSNGPVSANGVKGDASAKTSFGAVTLEDISGAITVDNQNGAVTVSAARGSSSCRPISLKTSFSPIQLRIPEDANYQLTARTSFGHITSEVPVTSTGVLSGDSLNGKIGNGGCTLSLTNSNGNIEILKADR